MIKAFLKYVLPLCIILLAFLGQLIAHAPEGSAYFASTNQLKSSVLAGLDQVQHNHFLFIKPAGPVSKKGNYEITATEKEAEEVESTSSKKYSESSTFFTAILAGQILQYLFSPLESYLAFCKNFSFFTSHRWYLIFRVFRI